MHLRVQFGDFWAPATLRLRAGKARWAGRAAVASVGWLVGVGLGGFFSPSLLPSLFSAHIAAGGGEWLGVI